MQAEEFPKGSVCSMFDRKKSSRMRKLTAGDQQVGPTGRRARPVSSSSHMPYACKSRMMVDVAATFRVWRLERRFENVDSRLLARSRLPAALEHQSTGTAPGVGRHQGLKEVAGHQCFSEY
jgi:hypothetical protein